MALAGLITSITSGRQCFVVVLNFILGLTIGIFVTVFMPQTESFNAGVAMMHQYSRGLLKNAPSNHTFTTPGTLLYKEKPEFTTPGVVLAGKTNDTAIPQNMPPEEQGKPTPKVPDGASGEKFTHATGPLLLDDKAYHQGKFLNSGLRMHQECRERFPRHRRLAIPTCTTTRAWRTCRDTCRDR